MKFCPECGTALGGTKFCPECGHDLRKYMTSAPLGEEKREESAPLASPAFGEETSAFFGAFPSFGVKGDDILSALEAKADACAGQAEAERLTEALSPFLYERHSNGKYAVIALKDKSEMVITVPDCVEAIGEGAFAGSEILEVSLPQGLLKIGKRAFADCVYLERLVLPPSVRFVEEEAFAGCSRLELSLPEGARVGKNVIKDTLTEKNRLAEEARQAEEARKAEEARLMEEQRLAEERRKAEEDARLRYYTPGLRFEKQSEGYCVLGYDGDETAVTIPERYKDGVVVSIGEDAFEGCKKMKKIELPDTLTEIGEWAFARCSLEKIEIPATVTTIGKGAFNDCTALKKVDFLDGLYGLYGLKLLTVERLTTIEEETFFGCIALKEITLPDSVTEIGECAFTNCKALEEIAIPDGVTELGDGAFASCTALKEIEIPDGVTELGEEAFADCASLKEIVLPDTLTKIGENAFSGCFSLEEIEIPDGVTEIGARAFAHCSALEEIEIPDSVIEIGESAFADCVWLEEIEIPDSVTEIGACAFAGCVRLEEICVSENTHVALDAFARTAYEARLKEEEAEEARKAEEERQAEEARKAEEARLMEEQRLAEEKRKAEEAARLRYYTPGLCFEKRGEEYCVSGYDGDEADVVIPAIYDDLCVTAIRWWAFKECGLLESVEIPDTVTDIGMSAFEGCRSLKRVRMGERVTKIGSCAFIGCKSLKSIRLPDSVKEIGGSAFYGCTSLTDVTLPAGLTVDHRDVFKKTPYRASLIEAEQWTAEGRRKRQYTDGMRFSEGLFGDDYRVSGGNFQTNEIVIPSFYNNKDVTEIDKGAIADGEYYVHTVKIPRSIEKIWAFGECKYVDFEYEGTVEEWNAIWKVENWDENIESDYTVKCADGTVRRGS